MMMKTNSYYHFFSKIFFFISILLLFASTVNAQEKEQEKIIIDQVIAVVGDNMVKESDIETQYLQMKAQGMINSSMPKCRILEDMLYQKLLLDQAAIDSIEVTEKEIDSELDRRLESFIRRIGSRDALEEYFNKSLIEIKNDFRKDIHEQLLIQRMQGQLTQDINITPADVENYFKSIPEDSLPLIDTKYEVAQIVITPEITDEQKQAIREKLQNLRKRIIKNDNFAAMAVLYSEDPTSAERGGDLDFISRTEVVPEFAAAAFSLEKDSISQVIETEFGYHLIKMLERRDDKVRVRHILMKPKLTSEARINAKQKLDSIATLIRIDSLTFADAAQKFSDDEDTKNNGGILVNPYTGTSKFSPNELDPHTSYMVKKLKPGQLSAPFAATDQRGQKMYKIIKLLSKTKPHVANLDQDYQLFKEKAMAEKQGNVINDWIENKIENSYIKIDPTYQNCSFEFEGWVR